MKTKIIVFLVVCSLVLVGSATAAIPSNRAATAAQIRKNQSLGRVIMDPAGRFLVYEWQRPFNWTPGARGLSKVAASRPQTTLYRVRIPNEWQWVNEPESEELFPMLPGATYWLGNLSPDGEWVSVHQLDRDDKVLKAGIAATQNKVDADNPPNIIWFDVPPDDARLERAAIWSADGRSLVYPIKGGLARVEAVTGKVTRCGSCSDTTVRSPDVSSTETAAGFDRTGIRPEAILVGFSTDRTVSAFLVDTPAILALYVRSMRSGNYVREKGSGVSRFVPGTTVTLFENARE